MFFKKKEKKLPPTDLSYVLAEFIRADDEKHHKEDVWRLEDAVRGLQIFGGIGSGKSSGSGREIALSYLRSGYSGIVLTAKVNEKDVWIEYAKEAGRLGDIVVFEPGGDYYFNPLQYELDRPQSEGGGHTDNIVSLFISIVKMGNRVDGSGGGSAKDPFWEMAMERCLKSDIDLLKMANKGIKLLGDNSDESFKITITNIAKVLRDTPIGSGHYSKYFKLFPPRNFDHHKAMHEWATQSFTIYCMTWASAYIDHQSKQLDEALERVNELKDDNWEAYESALNNYKKQAKSFESEVRTYDAISTYFLSELPTLAEKTRSSILEHFFAFAAPFRSGMLADYFAAKTSYEIMPERTLEGKIVILNFPVKKYMQLGIYAQSIYKKMWQQVVERRSVNESTMPVFMWIDESQNFLNADDMMFQTTARESRACTVLLSQNISNYYAVMGGSNSKAYVDSLLGNIGTKIFHNNNDSVMNEWASDTISKDYRGNLTSGESGVSVSDEYQYQFLPKDYSLLKTGGRLNEGIVEGVITSAGKTWSTGKNFLKIIFKQNLK